MSPLPSKFLIWWHKPITSPLEMTAIGNFHQVNDATTTNCKGVLLTAVPSMGYGLQNIRSKIATRDHVRDCVFGAGAPVWSLPDQNCYPRASLRRYSLRSLPEAFGVTVSADGDQELGRQRAARLDRQRLINCHGCRGRSVDYRPSLGPLAAPQPTAQSVRRCMFGTART